MNKFDIFIIFSIFIVIIATFFIYNEIKSARSYCISKNESFSLKFPHYFCGNKIIYKYKEGWDFERLEIDDINFTGIWNQKESP